MDTPESKPYTATDVKIDSERFFTANGSTYGARVPVDPEPATPKLNAQRLTALNASDLIKAGVMCVPDRGELPDAEIVGEELFACCAVGGGKLSYWWTINWDSHHGEWYAGDEKVDSCECWMLPPVLGK